MLEFLPLVIGGVAILVAVLALPGFRLLRASLIMMAAGSGQIYIAAAALLTFLLVENEFRVDFPKWPRHVVRLVLIAAAVAALTAFSRISDRTFSEYLQMLAYMVTFLMFASYLKSGVDVMRLLLAGFLGALGVGLLATFAVYMQWTAPPFIFIGRGANEGAIFLALVGTISGATLFVRTKNPLYIVGVLFLLYLEWTATSRSAMVMTGLALLSAMFFLTRNFLIRLVLVGVGGYLMTTSVPTLEAIFQSNINFSTRERLALLEWGWQLYERRFWLGWGWGSTSELAALAPNTIQSYPHFHNAFIQLLVELGVWGWLPIGIFATLFIQWFVRAEFRFRMPAMSTFAIAAFLGLIVAGFSDAMLFGADRVIQVLYLFALAMRMDSLAAGETHDLPRMPDTELAPSGLQAHAK